MVDTNMPPHASNSPAPARGRTHEPSAAIAAANVVLRHRRLVFLTAFLVTAVMVGLALSRERTFTSTTAFMPQSSGGSLAGLSSVAAQFGVSVGKEDPTQSPDFYSEVLKSRDLLLAIVSQRFTINTPTGQKSGPLAEVLELEAQGADQRTEAALKRLRQMLFVSITRQTGMLHVSVKSPSADLSRQIAERLLVQLDAFNTKLRQDRAAAEEQFLQQREDEARQLHAAAEERLISFLQRNRTFESAPSLSYEHSRLTREASHRSEIVASLTQARAQARIEAARNTPVITVLDRPNRAIRPDGRGVARALVLAIALGTVLGIVLALVADAFRRPDDGDEVQEFNRLQKATMNDLRHPLRALLPRRHGGREPVELT